MLYARTNTQMHKSGLRSREILGGVFFLDRSMDWCLCWRPQGSEITARSHIFRVQLSPEFTWSAGAPSFSFSHPVAPTPTSFCFVFLPPNI